MLSHAPWIASDRVILPTKDKPVLFLFYKNDGDTPAKIKFDYFLNYKSYGVVSHGNIKPETVMWMPGESYYETISVTDKIDTFVSGINNGTVAVRVIINYEDIFGKREIFNETYDSNGGNWVTESSSLVLPNDYLLK